jgi:hypothetical protein
MTLPGFNAETSLLYKGTGHYCTSAPRHQAGGMMLQHVPVQIPTAPLLPVDRFPQLTGPFPHILCGPCEPSGTLGCVQQCVNCPGPVPDERCTPFTLSCAASACCPPGQGSCNATGGHTFCCHPGETCCNPETNFCCPPRQTCCNPQTKFCCPGGQEPCCSPGNDFCCPPGLLCCDPVNKVCCPPGTCCGGGCCEQGQQCCGDSCTDVHSDTSNCGFCGNACPIRSQICVNGQCVCPPGLSPCPGGCVDFSTDLTDCGTCGNVCGPGQICVNGQCICPVVPDPFFCGAGGRASNSNYFLANGCQQITGLTVAFTATEDIVSTNGFTVQLNADSQLGVDAFQQYVFRVSGIGISAQINNWQNASTAIVCGASGVTLTPLLNGIPKGYTLRITLQYYRGTNVSGALFEVLNNGQTLGSQSLSVSQTGCNCSLPQGFTCTGYQSTADLSPITAFQVNIVGPGNGAGTTFTSGAGTISYSVSDGSLTALSSVPPCVVNPLCTAETSNASYGQLLACPEQTMTQTFNT